MLNQIDMDVTRANRGHIFFKDRFGQGQVSLFNVLKAYCTYGPDVAYCQGMADVTAFLLMYIEEEVSEDYRAAFFFFFFGICFSFFIFFRTHSGCWFNCVTTLSIIWVGGGSKAFPS